MRAKTHADPSLLWFPHWHNPADELPRAARLAALITRLEADDWGGIRLSSGQGPWAQVKRTRDAGFYYELHPYPHSPERPFVWISYSTTSPGIAARNIWRWVTRSSRE